MLIGLTIKRVNSKSSTAVGWKKTQHNAITYAEMDGLGLIVLLKLVGNKSFGK